MDNQVAVRKGNRLTNGAQQLRARGDREPEPVAVVVEALSLDIFHDQVRRLIGADSAIQHLRNMGMAKRGKDAALPEEALPYGRGDDVRLDRLDGYKLLELAIGSPRKIHDPSTPAT